MLNKKELEAMSTCSSNACKECTNCERSSNCSGAATCVEDMAETALELLSKVEVQENEIAQYKEIALADHKLADEVITENEQFKAQNAAMRKAFENYHTTWCGSNYCNEGCSVEDCGLRKLGQLCLSAEPIEYHNPADIEEIRVLREQLPEKDFRCSMADKQ